MMIKTFSYRLRNDPLLNQLAHRVNLIWNFCNDTQKFALKHKKKWPTNFDLINLTSGTSKELHINSQTVQLICDQYYKSRTQSKKPYLRYRGDRSLGWIPFKAQSITELSDGFLFMKQKYHIWKDRELPDEYILKSGSFSQNSMGHWFINITVEIQPKNEYGNGTKSIGIDLGLHTLATCSDGTKIDTIKFYQDNEKKLAKFQRAKKKKQVRNLNKKIQNRRKDYIHKQTTRLVNENAMIVVGDVSCKFSISQNAKSTLNVGWGLFRSLLTYKAIARKCEYIEINERYTTQTCSSCGVIPKSSPRGAKGLEIREWTCDECGIRHDRDVNAAKNILRLGLQSLAEGISEIDVRSKELTS